MKDCANCAAEAMKVNEGEEASFCGADDCPNGKRFTVESGRNIYEDGKPYVYLSIVQNESGPRYACPPAEADGLTHEIVRLLNSAEFNQNFYKEYMEK